MRFWFVVCIDNGTIPLCVVVIRLRFVASALI